ncbi:ABC transporter permease [Actinobaculum sp. 313]|uniref:ABC transporter permease n=1 Tax=Actinobaculum sp. 313 TaxID=2495645 RepID=UPI000D527C73|nr:ABC transporter permease [Actinobaculum sp. 313]AWE41598.1 ABC transporter permease [Actinobaculum sp. 313]
MPTATRKENGPDEALTSTGRPECPRVKPLQGLGSLFRHQFRHTVLYPGLIGFSVGLPLVMYFMFGASQSYSTQWIGHANVACAVMFGMGRTAHFWGGQYGRAGGRGTRPGWSRQLALTPVSVHTNFVLKILLALCGALLSLLVLMVAGSLTGAHAQGHIWVVVPLLILAGCICAGTMGIMTGYLVRSDAAYSIIGGVSVIFGFLAGAFLPLDLMPSFFRVVAPYTPLHGIYSLSQWPMGSGEFNWLWLVNIGAWTAVCCVVAIWRMRRDTERG